MVSDTNMDSLKKDLTGTAIIGVAAAVFAFVILSNLDVSKAYLWASLAFLPLCVVGILVGRFLSKYLAIMYKFVKFGEVGGLNWLVDLGVLNILIMITGFSTGIYFSVFKGISFVVSATNSYFWNKNWVFDKTKTKEVGKEVGKFGISTISGLIFNVLVATLILYFGKNVLTGLGDKNWANVAAIGGSLSAMIFNFVLYKFWVFK